VTIFRQPSIRRDVICPLATTLKMRGGGNICQPARSHGSARVSV
jgi:hypothetical protein